MASTDGYNHDEASYTELGELHVETNVPVTGLIDSRYAKNKKRSVLAPDSNRIIQSYYSDIGVKDYAILKETDAKSEKHLYIGSLFIAIYDCDSGNFVSDHPKAFLKDLKTLLDIDNSELETICRNLKYTVAIDGKFFVFSQKSNGDLVIFTIDPYTYEIATWNKDAIDVNFNEKAEMGVVLSKKTLKAKPEVVSETEIYLLVSDGSELKTMVLSLYDTGSVSYSRYDWSTLGVNNECFQKVDLISDRYYVLSGNVMAVNKYSNATHPRLLKTTLSNVQTSGELREVKLDCHDVSQLASDWNYIAFIKGNLFNQISGQIDGDFTYAAVKLPKTTGAKAFFKVAQNKTVVLIGRNFYLISNENVGNNAVNANLPTKISTTILDSVTSDDIDICDFIDIGNKSLIAIGTYLEDGVYKPLIKKFTYTYTGSTVTIPNTFDQGLEAGSNVSIVKGSSFGKTVIRRVQIESNLTLKNGTTLVAETESSTFSTGKSLWNSLRDSGMPYNTHVKAFGRIVLDGKDIPIENVLITPPDQEILIEGNNYGSTLLTFDKQFDVTSIADFSEATKLRYPGIFFRSTYNAGTVIEDAMISNYTSNIGSFNYDDSDRGTLFGEEHFNFSVKGAFLSGNTLYIALNNGIIRGIDVLDGTPTGEIDISSYAVGLKGLTCVNNEVLLILNDGTVIIGFSNKVISEGSGESAVYFVRDDRYIVVVENVKSSTNYTPKIKVIDGYNNFNNSTTTVDISNITPLVNRTVLNGVTYLLSKKGTESVKLFRVDPLLCNVEQISTVGTLSADSAITDDGKDSIYYRIGSSIYKKNVNTSNVETVTSSLSGTGFIVHFNDKIYAKSGTSAISVYDGKSWETKTVSLSSMTDGYFVYRGEDECVVTFTNGATLSISNEGEITTTAATSKTYDKSYYIDGRVILNDGSTRSGVNYTPIAVRGNCVLFINESDRTNFYTYDRRYGSWTPTAVSTSNDKILTVSLTQYSTEKSKVTACASTYNDNLIILSFEDGSIGSYYIPSKTWYSPNYEKKEVDTSKLYAFEVTDYGSASTLGGIALTDAAKNNLIPAEYADEGLYFAYYTAHPSDATLDEKVKPTSYSTPIGSNKVYAVFIDRNEVFRPRSIAKVYAEAGEVLNEGCVNIEKIDNDLIFITPNNTIKWNEEVGCFFKFDDEKYSGQAHGYFGPIKEVKTTSKLAHFGAGICGVGKDHVLLINGYDPNSDIPHESIHTGVSIYDSSSNQISTLYDPKGNVLGTLEARIRPFCVHYAGYVYVLGGLCRFEKSINGVNSYGVTQSRTIERIDLVTGEVKRLSSGTNANILPGQDIPSQTSSYDKNQDDNLYDKDYDISGDIVGVEDGIPQVIGFVTYTNSSDSVVRKRFVFDILSETISIDSETIATGNTRNVYANFKRNSAQMPTTNKYANVIGTYRANDDSGLFVYTSNDGKTIEIGKKTAANETAIITEIPNTDVSQTAPYGKSKKVIACLTGSYVVSNKPEEYVNGEYIYSFDFLSKEITIEKDETVYLEGREVSLSFNSSSNKFSVKCKNVSNGTTKEVQVGSYTGTDVKSFIINNDSVAFIVLKNVNTIENAFVYDVDANSVHEISDIKNKVLKSDILLNEKTKSLNFIDSDNNFTTVSRLSVSNYDSEGGYAVVTIKLLDGDPINPVLSTFKIKDDILSVWNFWVNSSEIVTNFLAYELGNDFIPTGNVLYMQSDEVRFDSIGFSDGKYARKTDNGFEIVCTDGVVKYINGNSKVSNLSTSCSPIYIGTKKCKNAISTESDGFEGFSNTKEAIVTEGNLKVYSDDGFIRENPRFFIDKSKIKSVEVINDAVIVFTSEGIYYYDSNNFEFRFVLQSFTGDIITFTDREDKVFFIQGSRVSSLDTDSMIVSDYGSIPNINDGRILSANYVKLDNSIRYAFKTDDNKMKLGFMALGTDLIIETGVVEASWFKTGTVEGSVVVDENGNTFALNGGKLKVYDTFARFIIDEDLQGNIVDLKINSSKIYAKTNGDNEEVYVKEYYKCGTSIAPITLLNTANEISSSNQIFSYNDELYAVCPPSTTSQIIAKYNQTTKTWTSYIERSEDNFVTKDNFVACKAMVDGSLFVISKGESSLKVETFNLKTRKYVSSYDINPAEIGSINCMQVQFMSHYAIVAANDGTYIINLFLGLTEFFQKRLTEVTGNSYFNGKIYQIGNDKIDSYSKTIVPSIPTKESGYLRDGIFVKAPNGLIALKGFGGITTTFIGENCEVDSTEIIGNNDLSSKSFIVPFKDNIVHIGYIDAYKETGSTRSDSMSAFKLTPTLVKAFDKNGYKVLVYSGVTEDKFITLNEKLEIVDSLILLRDDGDSVSEIVDYDAERAFIVNELGPKVSTLFIHDDGTITIKRFDGSIFGKPIGTGSNNHTIQSVDLTLIFDENMKNDIETVQQ